MSTKRSHILKIKIKKEHISHIVLISHNVQYLRLLVNKINKICSKLAKKTPVRRHDVTSSNFTHCSGVSIVDFEQYHLSRQNSYTFGTVFFAQKDWCQRFMATARAEGLPKGNLLYLPVMLKFSTPFLNNRSSTYLQQKTFDEKENIPYILECSYLYRAGWLDSSW